MELTRTLTLLLLLTLSASAQTPRIPPPESVNRNGLVGRWLVPGYQTGNGLTPTKAMDASGKGNHGTTVGSPNYGVIYSRAAMTLNGSSQHIDVGSGDLLNLTSNLTIMGWIKPVSFGQGGYGRIFERRNDVGGFFGYSLLLSLPTQTFRFSAIGVADADANANTAKLGVWQHVAVVRSSTTVSFYVNGFPAGGGTINAINGKANVTAVIGRVSNFNERWFDGSISDLRIYSRALAPAEIAAIYRGRQ
jgi:hypothetical protein